MNRRIRTIAWGALPVVALTALVSADHIPGTNIALTVPYAAEGTGPSIDTLGEVDGTEVVQVAGADTYPTAGQLNMTTVSVRSNMTLAQATARWLFTDDTLVPIEQIFPPGATQDQVQESNQAAFTASEASATVAALKHLGLPLQVTVAGVVEDTPASGQMEEGDVIVAVDDTPVDQPSQVRDLIGRRAPGEEVAVTVRRGEEQRRLSLILGEDPQEAGRPRLGVLMGSESATGVSVEYNLSDIGGPSAGMIFSLAVVDKLSEGDLTGGKFVAGTGTIAEDGTVGPIGGIKHKVRAASGMGAELFLSPSANCQEALSGNTGNTVIASVDTLDDAIAAMSDFAAGREVRTCE
ncbi:YlbL family protein [Corynebacterium oculi]|uniref:Lon protease n=1 Tax=Corynebacterium oculi TaxID=1544416 RepID=A0A0Q0TYC9_9CORY|nr:PDZ domain-containing protein [Corynebacterium oculi]KQB84108.1 Lon protease [Corynebacterium oculi]